MRRANSGVQSPPSESVFGGRCESGDDSHLALGGEKCGDAAIDAKLIPTAMLLAAVRSATIAHTTAELTLPPVRRDWVQASLTPALSTKPRKQGGGPLTLGGLN